MEKVIDDQYIINKFISNKKLNNNYNKWLTPEVSEYLLNRYSDTTCEVESIIRIYLKIDIRPVCKICGKPVKFNRSIIKPFNDTCSVSCASSLRASHVNIKKRNAAIKKAVKEKYGVDNVFQLNNVKEKIKEIKIERYGDPYWIDRNKVKETLYRHYGGASYFSNDELRKKSIEKKHHTVKEKYGVDNVFQADFVKEKIKRTLLKNWGVDNASKIDELKEIRKSHEYITKKKNNSFNKSKQEDQTFYLLKEKYYDVIRQYKSDVYPYCCDFYIPNLDLYIECNYHWTHGGHPYNSNNLDDYNKYNDWLNKNTKYYNNAIITWTCRDVNKRIIAKQNNLNYLEFFKFNEFKEWLETTKAST